MPAHAPSHAHGRAGAAGPEPLQPRTKATAEPWVTKRQLAKHLGVTPRWIEVKQHLGLPLVRIGGMNRYLISEVDAWLRKHGDPAIGGE